MPKSINSPRHELVKAALIAQRKASGMSQTKVAEALKRPQSYVAKVEGGERRLDVIELVELADTIGLDLHALVDDLRRAPR